MTHPDSVKLEEAIRSRLRSACDGQFRLLPRGFDTEAGTRLEALWDRLVMEGPGVEMIRTIIDAYDTVMTDVRRRDGLWRRVSTLIEEADTTRLVSLEQLVTLFEGVPVPLHIDLVEADIVDDDVKTTKVRRRIDCVICGAEIRYEADQINTDEPEPGRGWVHVSDEKVVCDTGEGRATPPPEHEIF